MTSITTITLTTLRLVGVWKSSNSAEEEGWY
jgi:hypothetical protein